jgi:hypothetical protein
MHESSARGDSSDVREHRQVSIIKCSWLLLVDAGEDREQLQKGPGDRRLTHVVPLAWRLAACRGVRDLPIANSRLWS